MFNVKRASIFLAFLAFLAPFFTSVWLSLTIFGLKL